MWQTKTKIFNSFNVKNHLILSVNYHKKIAAAYKPKDVESKAIPLHNQNENLLKKSKFSMMLPPPNVTGHLHLGHALMCTIQDVMARWRRTQGFEVIWIPGTDHAGIATQIVVEKHLRKEMSKSRHDLGRNEFLNEIWKWKNEKGHKIVDDLKRIGTTLNWEREYFTMDEIQSKAVNEAFIRLFEENLIYRNESLVNWSCALESAISDIEVESLEVSGPTQLSVPGYSLPITFGQITDIIYKAQNDNKTEIVVSTTRPETLLGDVAIAVHPNDQRYSKLLNDKIRFHHPFRKEPIPLIVDEGVDPEFGSGAVKITPAHDKFDYEVARKHNLKSIPVINEKGLIYDHFELFSGMPRFAAREKIKNELASLGLLGETKSHKTQLPICARSRDIVEYLLRPQWFVRCKNLAEAAADAVRTDQIKIIPKNFENEWFRWLENIQDWCISRQVWWGHQIPAYTCTLNRKSVWIAAHNKTEAMAKAKNFFKSNSNQSIDIVQDTDVLDTWFSSALLPFSCFGWPNSMQKYYPLDIMETGHDILFFWVARMTMLGIQLTGQVPFKEILLHGIICDAHGRKMSKSLGNVIHPEQVISGATLKDLKNETKKLFDGGILSQDEFEKSLKGQEKLFPFGIPECGVDSLRFTLCSHNIKSHFINFDVNECHTNKLFFNKIWQATKYTIMVRDKANLNDVHPLEKFNRKSLTDMDQWILSRLGQTVQQFHQALNEYNFHLATAALKMFFYSNFCDVYLETTKQRSDDLEDSKMCGSVLSICLSVGLEMMKHFTPFLAAGLLQYLPPNGDFDPKKWIDVSLESKTEDILSVCSTIRQIKSEQNISKKYEPKAHLFTNDTDFHTALLNHQKNIQQLSQCAGIIIHQGHLSDFKEIQFAAQSTAGHLCSFGIEINSNSKIAAKDSKKLDKLVTELGKLEKTVANEGYKKSASEKVQMKHQEKISQLKLEIANIKMIDEL